MKRIAIFGVMAAVAFCFAGVAKADDIHLCDIAAQCNNGALTATSSTTLYLYGKNTAGDDIYLIDLAPLAGTGGAFNSTTGFYSALSTFKGTTFTPANGVNQPQFSPLSSNYTAATGLTAGSFDFNSATNLGPLALGENTFIAESGLPPGSVVLALLVSANNTVDGVTPYSSDFAIGTTTTPEPASMLLLGLGLVGVPFLRRRK